MSELTRPHISGGKLGNILENVAKYGVGTIWLMNTAITVGGSLYRRDCFTMHRVDGENCGYALCEYSNSASPGSSGTYYTIYKVNWQNQTVEFIESNSASLGLTGYMFSGTTVYIAPDTKNMAGGTRCGLYITDEV